MHMTHERAKIFKLMNAQMYDNERFQLEHKVQPDNIVIAAQDLKHPHYSKEKSKQKQFVKKVT